MVRLRGYVVLALMALALVPAAAQAVNPEAVVGGPTSKWISGDLLQQTGTNCSILGSPYTEVMISGIAAYGGKAGVPVVGDTYYTSFLIGIPGNPCGSGSSSVSTTLVLPPNTSIDTSLPIRCFGQGRTASTFTEITNDSWSFLGSSGPYCPTGASPSALHQGALFLGFRPLANGQLFQMFVPVKSTQPLIGAGANPADGFRWLTDASGVYANPGLSTVWANVFAASGGVGPFIYFAGSPVIPFWKSSAPAGQQNRAELFVNLNTDGWGGTLCYEIRRISDNTLRATCAIDPGYNPNVPAGLSLAQLLPDVSVQGPNKGYAPFYFDGPPALDPEWDQDMKIIWTFTPTGVGHPPAVTRSATFHTLAGPDTDGDGVADIADACPATHGTLANGCLPPVQPDPDSDGVYGDTDLCPLADGQGSLNGCPGGVVPPVTQPVVTDPVITPPVTVLGGTLNVARNARLPRAGLLKGRKLAVTCTRDATATAVLTITKKTAKKLRIKTGKATLPIATATGACKAAGGGSLKLKLLAKYAKAVKRSKGTFPGTLALTLTAAGQKATPVKAPVKVG